MAVGLLLTLFFVLGIALINLSVDAQRNFRCLRSQYGRIEFRTRGFHSTNIVISELQRQTARLPILQSVTLPRMTPVLLGRARDEDFFALQVFSEISPVAGPLPF